MVILKKFVSLLVLCFLTFNCAVLNKLGGSLKNLMSNSFADQNPETVVRRNETRQFRVLKLANEMEVLLVSSPEYNKSSAALDVAVGSLEDPWEHPGLAHFLEHMLFLGTSKYPKVGEYNEYLAAHGGMSNAYTARESTNYYFEVNNDAFEGALDRFSHFFIDPLFLSEYVERELNAVHSEHQKNLNSDAWRKNRLLGILSKKGHSRQKFSTGNLETLKNVSNEVLVGFYKKYYSANQMKLSLLSPASLDQMEAWVKEKFSTVNNNKRDKLKYDPNTLDAEALPRLVYMKPVKDLRVLELIFPTPSSYPYWESKPEMVIPHLIGHEGQGSLLSYLKKQNLATSLSAGFEDASYVGNFHFKIGLTDKGLENKNEVLSAFFSYVSMLKQEGYPQHIYKELRALSNLDFIYKEHSEGGSVASRYASGMQYFPALEIEKQGGLFYKHGVEDFNRFLSKITPENMSVLLISQNVKTDQVEEYYNVEYASEKIKQDVLMNLNNVPQNEAMFLPKQNDYIPSYLTLVEDEKSDEPYTLIDSDLGKFWFKKDNIFKQPKGRVTLEVETPLINSSPKSKVLSILYQKVLSESLNEWRYQVLLAGMDFSLNMSEKGVVIDFDGYSQHLPKLMKDLASKLQELEISEDNLLTLKDDFKRDLRNMTYDKAYRKLLYEMGDLVSGNSIHYKQYYDPMNNIDLISTVSLEEIKDFSKDLYSKVFLKGLAYGNLSKDDVKEAIYSYAETLNSIPLKKSERPSEKVYQLTPGTAFAYSMNEKEGTKNNCWANYVQFGDRTYDLNAAIRIGHAMLSADFYNELRTQQQLGYIVHSGLRYYEKSLGLIFLIQSSAYDPVEIQRRYVEWVKKASSRLDGISNFEFNTYKSSVVQELREEDKTIAEMHGNLYFETVIMDGMFNYKEEIAKSVEKLSKDDIKDIFTKALNNETSSSLTLFLSKEKSNDQRSEGFEYIEDRESFKKAMPVYK